MDMYIGISSKLITGAIGIFILLRIMGKKTMSELTPFDLIYILLLGAVVEEAIYDDKVNALHVLFAIVLWGLFVYAIEKALQHTDKFSTFIEGEPAILIEKGRLNLKELDANFFDIEQLRSMLRQNNVYSIADVYYAILEVNGNLTVITKDEAVVPSALLIEFGTIQENTLNYIMKDELWLRTELSKQGHDDLDEIVYCEWLESSKELKIETYDNTIHKKIYIDD